MISVPPPDFSEARRELLPLVGEQVRPYPAGMLVDQAFRVAAGADSRGAGRAPKAREK